MESARVWAVRAGCTGEADSLFIHGGQLALDIADLGDDASLLPASRGAFKAAMLDAGAAEPAAIPVQAGQLYRFVHEMRIGDRVIYPRKIDRTLHWGEVVGPYVFDGEDRVGYPHRREVRWRASLSRDAFSQGALYELSSALSLFEVRAYVGEFSRKLEARAGAARAPAGAPCVAANSADDDIENNAVRDIGESTKDYISRVLKSRLKGYPLEPFVADLFRAMGYRARTTRAVRDEGVDVIAHRDELGIEPPILKIQVKSHEANISADPVKAFYAMVHERDVGIFVTTGDYTSAARDFARTKANLRLVAGVELIDLIQKHYDGLNARHRQLIPLRKVLVPDPALELA